jgi:hypothetical protein
MKALALLAVLVFICGCAYEKPDKDMTQAIATHDNSYCVKIKDARMRYNCSLSVLATQDNATRCLDLENPGWKADCIDAIAARKKDLKTCDLIEQDLRRDDCMKVVGKSM